LITFTWNFDEFIFYESPENQGLRNEAFFFKKIQFAVATLKLTFTN